MAGKALFWMVAVLVVLFGLSGMNSVHAAEGTVTIAVAGPLTGTAAQDGADIKNGAILAAEAINAKGGIKGQKIELIFEDDRSDPKEAASIANKLANDKKVVAVIGHYNSSCTLAGAPIYNKAHLIEVSAGSTSPAVTNAGPYTYRVIVTDAFQGDFVARWMVKDAGYKNIAILYENDDYGLGIKDALAAKVAQYGGKVVGVESYYVGETKDFSPYITKLRALNPDALFIGGLYNEGALIAKQSADVGWTPPIFGVDGLYSPALVQLGGKATEGIRVSGFYHPALPDPMVQAFVKDFKAKFNAEPGTYGAFGYDALLALAEAIDKASSPTREAINEALLKTKVRGVTGLNVFDENGDVIKDPIKLVVKDGKFQPDQK